MNPSNFLKIAVAVFLLTASSARAQKNDGSVRKDRVARVVKAVTAIDKFCDEAADWKVARLDPDNGAWSDLQKQDESADAAKRKRALKYADADMGNWKQSDKDAMRARVAKVREQCAAMKNPDGLLPLLAKDAPLEKIHEGSWNNLLEKLDEVALQYQGKDSRDAESANEYYLNYYGRKKAAKGYGHADRINQLTSDSVQQLTEVVERGELKEAVEDLKAAEKQ
jgi:hypothetical protein